MGATLAGVLVAALAIAGLPHTSRASPQVGVTLLNDNVVPVDRAERAQAEVTRLYKLIGVEVVWLAEPPPDEEVRTIKLTTWEPRDDHFRLRSG